MKKYIAIISVILLGTNSMKAQFATVDLGLSVKWASCNVGATSPEECGDYFAWGETSTKTVFSLSSYRWRDETSSSVTKYFEGDKRMELTWDDDAAHKALGGKWRMPTEAEVKELIDGCYIEKTTSNGVEGLLFTSRITSKSIFIPAAGFYDNDRLSGKGRICYIWTSQVHLNGNSISVLENDQISRWGATRTHGIPVRPVYDF